ncbi:MAG: membrane protein of unknown function [Methanothrix sp.]|nr:MAG: membrane protein of unknown function [Methanothrix sp.]
MDGYLTKSFLFDLNLLFAIAVSILAAVRMKTKNLLALIISSAALMFVVERILTSAGIVDYSGSPGPTLFVVSGWALVMVAIFGISDLFRLWFERLQLFDRIERWRPLPFAAAVAVFAVFFYLEGYFQLAGRDVLGLYAAMALLGIIFSGRSSIEWNAALVAVSVGLGGYMELLGYAGGLWSYDMTEGLPIFMTIATTINAGAVLAVASIAGVDLSRSTPGSAEERRRRRVHP